MQERINWYQGVTVWLKPNHDRFLNISIFWNPNYNSVPVDAVFSTTCSSFTGRQLWALCGWLDAFILGNFISNSMNFSPKRLSFLSCSWNTDDWSWSYVSNCSHQNWLYLIPVRLEKLITFKKRSICCLRFSKEDREQLSMTLHQQYIVDFFYSNILSSK